MALISCPECRLRVSDKAASCPYCGYVFKGVKKSILDIATEQYIIPIAKAIENAVVDKCSLYGSRSYVVIFSLLNLVIAVFFFVVVALSYGYFDRPAWEANVVLSGIWIVTFGIIGYSLYQSFIKGNYYKAGLVSLVPTGIIIILVCYLFFLDMGYVAIP